MMLKATELADDEACSGLACSSIELQMHCLMPLTSPSRNTEQAAQWYALLLLAALLASLLLLLQ